MCQPAETKDELIKRTAENLAAVIAETRPRGDELRDLLATELRKLVDAVAAIGAPKVGAGGGGSSGFG